MKLSALLQDVPYIRIEGCSEMEISGLDFDSRRCKAGTAFGAIARESVDGHSYIDAAVANGASVIVAKYPVEGVCTVVCENPNETFSRMVANFHGNPQSGMKLIGITGTKGKTSTAFYVKAILDAQNGTKCGLMGTVQNMAGDEKLGDAHNSTPEVTELYELLSAMRQRGCTHAVMEVSSHAMALGRVAGLQYACSVFTNLSQDHLNFHKTMENYLAAKAMLFAQSDTAVINVDDPASAVVLDAATGKVRTLSTKCGDASLFARDIELKSDCVTFTAVADGAEASVTMPTPGLFSVYNALCALGVAVSLGILLTNAARAIETAGGVPGRAEVVQIPADFRVVVDYAHSPDSVEKIVEATSEYTKGRLISIVGCGGNRDRTKRPKMAAAAARGSDVVILTTDNPRDEVPEDIIAEMVPGLEGTKAESKIIVDRREAIHHALRIAKPGDTVLIMGKGHETYQEVRGVRSHFDDREEVRNYFKA